MILQNNINVNWIHILFPAGGYGSTLEYCLRRFTKEYFDKSLESVTHNEDGSMHSYKKMFHPVFKHELLDLKKQILSKPGPGGNITTPVYANLDQSPQEVIDTFIKLVGKDKVIFVEQKNIDDILIVAYCKLLKTNGYPNANKKTIWETRENIALIISNLDTLKLQNINRDWYTIRPLDLAINLEQEFLGVCKFLNLSVKNFNKLKKFNLDHIKKQQFIFDSINNLKEITKHIIDNDIEYEWKKLNFNEECILQALLLLEGFEVECYNLNLLPNNVKKFRKLLIK